MNQITMPNDPVEMKIAANASWLCNLFQKHSLTCEEKQAVLKEIFIDFKERQLKDGQSN